MLVVGIGNIYGKYFVNWFGLDFDVLVKIEEVVGIIMFLVLYGGIGIFEDMIKKVILLGVVKINVNIEC